MAVTLATTAKDRLSLGYNGTGTGVCGYNGQPYDAVLNPGGMDGNGVAVNWINLCADMVSVGILSADYASVASAAASQQQAWGPTWGDASGQVTYIDATHFSVDVATDDFGQGTFVVADCGADGPRYGVCQTAVTYGSVTTVTVAWGFGGLTTNIKSVTTQDRAAIYVADFANLLSQTQTQAENAAASQAAAAASESASTTQAMAAAVSAAAAANSAGNNIRGLDSDRAPANYMLGTAAYTDQSWIDTPASTWDAGSVASGAQTSTTIAAPGADVGDYVVATCESSLQGLYLRGVVTARNTVTLYLANLTGATVDLASAVYHVRILKLIPQRG